MTGDMQHDATTELNEALAAGFAAGNFDALGPFYTEDAVLMPPRGKIQEGRTSASAFWLGVANRITSAAFTTTAMKNLGDAARREAGTYVMSGGDGQSFEGKYVFVWQFVEGEWQIESAIWNRNGEAGSGRHQGQGAGQGQRRQGGGQGGYRRGGQGGGGGGYRQGGRPSFQQGGAGAGGRRRPGGGHQGGPDGGHGGGGSLYEGDAGLYSGPKG